MKGVDRAALHFMKSRRLTVRWGQDGVEISVISKADLVRNKRAAGRAIDAADLEHLTGGEPER